MANKSSKKLYDNFRGLEINKSKNINKFQHSANLSLFCFSNVHLPILRTAVQGFRGKFKLFLSYALDYIESLFLCGINVNYNELGMLNDSGHDLVWVTGWRKKSLGIFDVEGILINDFFRYILFVLEQRVRHDFSFERSIWKKKL